VYPKEFLESDKRPWFADMTRGSINFETALFRVRTKGECFVARYGLEEILMEPIKKRYSVPFIDKVLDVHGGKVISYDTIMYAVTHSRSALQHFSGYSDISYDHISFLMDTNWYPHTKESPFKRLSVEKVMSVLSRSKDFGLYFRHPALPEHEAVGRNGTEGFVRFWTDNEPGPISRSDESWVGAKRAWDWDKEIEKIPALELHEWEESLHSSGYWGEDDVETALMDWKYQKKLLTSSKK
jgi:hypothetical protein